MDYTTLQILSRKQLVQLPTKYYQLNFLKPTLHSVPLTDGSVATVLIFLGILTFGQMAYVDWLNDVGRVLLIMFTGFVFFGIAYFSEKKNILVFSNVFYSLSIFIVYYSLILAHFSFSLVNGHILSYLVLLLMD